MALNKGEQAPNFTLFSSENKQVSLNSFRGKNVVIHFFPMAFTGVCTTQLCTLRDDIESYTSLGAEILGISVDSPFTLAKFKEDQNYNFNLLSDFNKETSKAYNALYEEFVMGMKGVSKRAAYVIDKEGVIQYLEVLESAGDLPDFNKIKEALNNL
jgi:peroxiredoxin